MLPLVAEGKSGRVRNDELSLVGKLIRGVPEGGRTGFNKVLSKLPIKY